MEENKSTEQLVREMEILEVKERMLDKALNTIFKVVLVIAIAIVLISGNNP